MTGDGPLSGLRVLDVASILAGPLCCQILCDYGAEVIKIEEPGVGDAMRGHGETKDDVPLWWKELGRNKRVVGLRLSVPAGAELFKKLCETADVVVESFRPGTLERWGIGPDVLRAVNPRLVIVRISGFGQIGPYASRPGFGTLAEAMSGFAYLTGQPDGPPQLPAFGLADSICGIAASSATLMALRHRDRTGDGQVVDLSLLEPILTAAGPGPIYQQQLGLVQRRHGNQSANNSPRNMYRTCDDEWVVVSASARKIADRVLTLVGHPEVANEPWFETARDRAAHADVIDGYIAEWMAKRTRDEVVAAFEEAGAAVAPVYSAADVVQDPQVRAAGMLVEVDDPDLGPLLMHNVMWRMSESPGRIRFAGRSPGADTEQILTEELEMSSDVVDQLRADGVVG